MSEVINSRPPGPKPHFLYGNFPLASATPLETFTRWTREFGDIFYYRAGWVHVYFLNHPHYVESVLVDQYQSFMKDRVVRNARWLFGKGLLTNEGDSWLQQRRIIQPAFHRQRIASYARTMTTYTEKMLMQWRDGETCNIHDEMMRLTLKIVAKLLFSVEVEEESEKIAGALNVLMGEGTQGRMIFPPILRFLPIPAMASVRRAAHLLDEISYRLIRQRRADPNAHTDLLAMLMQAKDENGNGMDDRQLRDEAITFLLAGHETTALSLSWAWYLLSQNPDAEAKLHRELNELPGGRSPNSEDLPQLIYTERVVKEAMRLYPPAWAVARTLIKDIELGGYRVPKGSNIVISQWVMHRDARFFRDPEKFDPDRWSPERAQEVPKFAYFPFGAGPRGCVGQSFAMMEAILLLATVAQRFKLRVPSDFPVIPTPSVTLRPQNGLRAVLYRR
jgi:cytochrome P450